MAAGPGSQAIQISQQLMSASSTLMQLYTLIVTMDAQWTDQGVANSISSMATVTLNPDGSAGAADGTPNPNHPISPTVYPSLGRLISANEIEQVKTIIDGVVAYINGQAVAAQPGARAILNVAIGG